MLSVDAGRKGVSLIFVKESAVKICMLGGMPPFQKHQEAGPNI
jgi:hypothetical protein